MEQQTQTENENSPIQPLTNLQVPPPPPEQPTLQSASAGYPPPPPHQNHPKRSRRNVLATVLIVAMLATSLVSAAAIYSVISLNVEVTSLQNQIKTLQSALNSGGTTSASYVDSSADLSALYDAVEDSVVTIDCTITQYYTNPFSRQQQSITAQAQGSGFIYDYNGQMVIITNNHVIEGATTIEVTFADGNTYTAKVLGTDAATDLAVLSTNAPASAYDPLDIISSSAVSVGDSVVAIGSPYGLSGTMTTGIISALNRTITVSESSSTATSQITGLLQTSAPINSGNSGGPLMTYSGKVIGITTAIVSNSDGLGFAVPSDAILSFLDQVLA
ncbi:MAG: S1C family serine protease [Candidatus Bathyarchaeota archaeon]|nr:S1C family serine protease [Candidatus Bathyarchaeota archaeon]